MEGADVWLTFLDLCVLFYTFNVGENIWRGKKYSTLFLRLESKTSCINFVSENIFILGLGSRSYGILPSTKNERDIGERRHDQENKTHYFLQH